MQPSIFSIIIILLVAAVAASLIFRYFKLPVILGYLFVGTLLGPHLLNWIGSTQDIQEIAEFGVVFLLFTIGLEFSLSRLIAMRMTVLGYGGLQVLTSVVATVAAATALGMTIEASIIIGTVVAMSSTAIVMKQLADQAELYLNHGSNAVAILLLQDLAVIPALILIPSLAATNEQSFVAPLIWSLIKGTGVVFIIIQLGRRVLRPALHRIAAMQSPEAFTLATLLVALSSAWLTHYLGLSLTLGAFLAGMMLGETEYRHQINIEIRPFRDVLLGLFFITIGMQLNIILLANTWMWVLLLVAALVLFKILLIFTLGLIFKKDRISAFRTGVVLAQGGEFGLAILFLAQQYAILPTDYAQVVLAAICISMVISPILIRFNKQLATLIFGKSKQYQHDQAISEAKTLAEDLTNHAIICGYGRVGQNIARLLEKEKLDFIALDLDVMRVQQAQIAGDNIAYGDASHAEMLRAIGINHARSLVICIDETASVIRILNQARRVNANIPILVRSYDDKDLEIFQKQGATEVIPETQESSLILGSHLLLFMGIPAVKVHRQMEMTRRNRYELFRRVFPSTNGNGSGTAKQLHSIILTESSYAIGRSVGELTKDLGDIKIVAIQQAGTHNAKPKPTDKLFYRDVVVVFATDEESERANKVLLEGP